MHFFILRSPSASVLLSFKTSWLRGRRRSFLCPPPTPPISPPQTSPSRPPQQSTSNSHQQNGGLMAAVTILMAAPPPSAAPLSHLAAKLRTTLRWWSCTVLLVMMRWLNMRTQGITLFNNYRLTRLYIKTAKGRRKKVVVLGGGAS